MPEPLHSTGRGGAGNIGEDPTTYVDASIVREGVAGESSRPEYSSGRGGAGNIVPSPRNSPALKAQQSSSAGTIPQASGLSEEVIPEPSMRSGEGYENYHTGRGGQGNVHKDKYGGHSKEPNPEGKDGGGLLEKAKHVIGLDKDKGHKESPLKKETGSS